MTPSWYDVLDVEPTATREEIRDAWRSSIADLDPGERNFRLRNQAAEVLLDEDRRREYDATLVEEEEPGDEVEVEPDDALTGVVLDKNLPKREPLEPETSPAPGPDDDGADDGAEPTEDAPDPSTKTAGAAPRPRPTPARLGLIIALGVVALAMLAFTLVVVIAQTRAADREEAAKQGLAAAEQAIAPVLSYDYRQMEKSRAAAENFLTPKYAKEYAKLFAQLEINLPETETVVTTEVVASGLVSAESDEVLAFVFVNRPTVKAGSEPQVYRDQVTVRMKLIDDEWLIDELSTEDPPA